VKHSKSVLASGKMVGLAGACGATDQHVNKPNVAS
jgi:hypothetical protein